MPTKDLEAFLPVPLDGVAVPSVQHRSTPYYLEALRLRDHANGKTDHDLWGAIRSFCASAPIEQVPRVVEFLRDQDPGRTHQCTFQGLYSVLEVERPLHTHQWQQLRARVVELCLRYTEPEWLGEKNAEREVLAGNCYLILELIGSSDLIAEFQDRVARTQHLVQTIGRLREWRQHGV